MTWKIFVCSLLLPCAAFAQTSPAGPSQQEAVSGSIARGSLHRESFSSKFIKGLPGDRGEYVVYTPPNYNRNRKPAYPVLYLLHGWGGNQDAWVSRGHADAALDRMIASGTAQPMIVVMPLGYGDMTFLTNGFEVWRDEVQISNNVNLFGQALIHEIIPAVDKSYDVATDREHRAIAGLSMGGLEALTIGLRHPELFAWVGGFSSAIFPISGQALTALEPANENLRLLWIACGTEDDLLSINRIFEMHLRQEGIPMTVVETPGRHEWPVWRNNLDHFVPLLFSSSERAQGVAR